MFDHGGSDQGFLQRAARVLKMKRTNDKSKGSLLRSLRARPRMLAMALVLSLVSLSNLVASKGRSNTDELTDVLLVVSRLGVTALDAPDYDPSKIMSPEACSRCHVQESQVWRQTPHAHNFEQLQRNPEARRIAANLGIRSVKRSELCASCHYTQKESDGKNRVVAGVSCESCHGAARDWITIHNDFGGASVSSETESATHRANRLQRSRELGMRNPQNIYEIARSCLQCHTVPHESLVNQGGHIAGSQDFEFVAWSQGSIRHKFRSARGAYNAQASGSRLRVMYVAGMIADLEFSTRATAIATQRSGFGVESADRAARVALELKSIWEATGNEQILRVLQAFAAAELRTNNAEQLQQIADEIEELGREFAEIVDGDTLAGVDAYLPDVSEYR